MIYQKQTIKLEELIISYQELKSVWKVGEKHGLCGQSVHERLSKAGVIKRMNYFTEADKELLRKLYPIYKESNRLDDLAKQMNRTKQFICRKAKELGMTTRFESHTQSSKDVMSKKAIDRIARNGHPRGMKGKKHTIEAKSRMSVSSKRNWANPESNRRSEKEIQRRSDVMFQSRINGDIKSKSNRKEFDVKINHKDYHFKSSWEYEFALILERIKNEGFILSWSYEPIRFIFEDVKQGIRSYLPDFVVFNKKGESIFFEVKGWKMENGMKRIEMFKERYPNIKLYVIDEREYKKVISEANYILRYTE